MAKDNVPFHSVIFPVTLRGSQYSNITDIDIASTEYLLYEGNKFSKTNNVGLFCDDVVRLSKKLDIPPDYWRAYLISIRPESADSNFVLNDQGGFVDFVNNILLKNFGNLVHRVRSVAFQIRTKHNIDQIKFNIDINADMDDCTDLVQKYHKHMSEYKLCKALNVALSYSTKLNQCVNDFAPWVLIKDNSTKDKLYEFMGLVYHHLDILLTLLEPFMPTICCNIRQDLAYSNQNNTILLPESKPIIVIKPLNSIVVEDRV